jgi:hypothetical protein
MNTKELNNRFAELKEAKSRANKLRTEYDEKLRRHQTSVRGLSRKLSKEYELIEEISCEIRESALEIYNVTKKQDIIPGVFIKIRTRYRYDMDKAIEWAKKEAPMLVDDYLDTRGFEYLCRVSMPEFVEEIITHTPVIDITYKEVTKNETSKDMAL